MKYRNIILLLIIIMMLLVVACDKTDDNNISHFQQEIESLRSLNQQLTETNSSLTSDNEALKEQLKLANEEIANQKTEMVKLNDTLNAKQYDMFPPSLSYGYLGYNPDFYVLIENETFIKMLPYDNAQDINMAFKNSLVRVLDKAQFQSLEEIEKDRYWYYVEIAVYDTPLNTRGWIRVDKTVPYTKENQHLVISPITVEDGSKIYEEGNPVDHDNAKFTLSEYESGMIEEHRGDYVRITSGGGRDFWTKFENVIYPEIKIPKNE